MPTDIPALVQGWCSHFASADREIEWLAAEIEHEVWLNENTVLMGRMDALGLSQGPFFGEWKTSNGRDRATWKQTWRMNPQSLTYGVLADDWFQRERGTPCRRFTVRKAFKPGRSHIGMAYDHAWFSYSADELAHWRAELVRIAGEIRTYGAGPWPTNFSHCFAYGPNYACPFFESACSKLDWSRRPADALVRISHLEKERALGERCLNVSDLVVLDATRVAVWFACRERFRRTYIENVDVTPGEALRDGIDFHERIGAYYGALVGKVEQGLAERALFGGQNG